MPVYSVTYDLNKQGQDYSNLIKHLESYEHCKYQRSCWLIKSPLPVEPLSQKIQSLMDVNDFLLVIEVTKEYFGWLSEQKWREIAKLFE